MTTKSKRSWKQERASVHTKNASRPRSNKYRPNDNDRRPTAGSRTRVWVGGYTRADGTHVDGHYRESAR